MAWILDLTGPHTCIHFSCTFLCMVCMQIISSPGPICFFDACFSPIPTIAQLCNRRSLALLPGLEPGPVRRLGVASSYVQFSFSTLIISLMVRVNGSHPLVESKTTDSRYQKQIPTRVSNNAGVVESSRDGEQQGPCLT